MTPRTIPADKKQVNFNIESESYEKLRVISFVNRMTFSEIYQDAINNYISSYEKENGKINVKQGVAKKIAK